MHKFSTTAIFAAAIALFHSSPANAAKGEIVAECGSSWYLISAPRGYALVQWYGGSMARRGQQIVGEFEAFGMKQLYNISADREMKVWVDNFWLSRDRAIEKFREKCR